MGQTINVSDDGKYLILKISGEINRKTAMEYNIESHKKGKELGIKKYLCDLIDAKNIETNIDNYVFAYKDMQNPMAVDTTACVAMVVDPEDHSHDFVETVSRNAGLNVKLFRDYNKAVEYLKSIKY